MDRATYAKIERLSLTPSIERTVHDKIKVLDERLWPLIPQAVIAEAEAAAATQPCWIARQGNGHIVAMDGPGDPEVAMGDVLFIAEIGPG